MSTRITDLPQATELNGSEIMPLVQNGVTKKATLDFVNLASPAGVILQQTQQVYQDTIGVKRDFETQYLGPHASLPTLDNEGNPLQNGALYWDTSLMAMFVWDGANWTAFSSAVASVERGSNANGEYVRFADGTQICWRNPATASYNITTAIGSLFRSGVQAFPYPAAFSDTPSGCAAVIGTDGRVFVGTCSTEAQWSILLFSGVSGAAISETLRMVAVGRWF